MLFLLTSTVYKKQQLKTILQIQNNKSVRKSTRFLKPMDILQSFLTASGYCILLKLWQLKQTRNRAVIPAASNREVLVESSHVTPAVTQPQPLTCCNIPDPGVHLIGKAATAFTFVTDFACSRFSCSNRERDIAMATCKSSSLGSILALFCVFLESSLEEPFLFALLGWLLKSKNAAGSPS